MMPLDLLTQVDQPGHRPEEAEHESSESAVDPIEALDMLDAALAAAGQDVAASRHQAMDTGNRATSPAQAAQGTASSEGIAQQYQTTEPPETVEEITESDMPSAPPCRLAEPEEVMRFIAARTGEQTTGQSEPVSSRPDDAQDETFVADTQMTSPEDIPQLPAIPETQVPPNSAETSEDSTSTSTSQEESSSSVSRYITQQYRTNIMPKWQYDKVQSDIINWKGVRPTAREAKAISARNAWVHRTMGEMLIDVQDLTEEVEYFAYTEGDTNNVVYVSKARVPITDEQLFPRKYCLNSVRISREKCYNHLVALNTTESRHSARKILHQCATGIYDRSINFICMPLLPYLQEPEETHARPSRKRKEPSTTRMELIAADMHGLHDETLEEVAQTRQLRSTNRRMAAALQREAERQQSTSSASTKGKGRGKGKKK